MPPDSGFLSSPDNLVRIAQIAAVLCGALIALHAFRVNRNTNWYLKSMDVMLKCNERYDALLAIRTDLTRREAEAKGGLATVRPPSPHEVDTFARRFWGLQVDQFDYYQLGMIERGVFIDWAIHKVRLFQNNEVIGDRSFRERFRDMKTNAFWEKRDFTEFFTYLEELSDNRSETYDTLVRKLKRWLAARHDGYLERQKAWFWARHSPGWPV
jgi:hypothetical protein